MSLDAETIRRLNLPLDMRRVQKRQGAGGKSLDYMASHDVIRTANAVFGYGKWGTETTTLTCIGEQQFEKNGKVGWRVGYRCTVRLSVDGCVSTDGSGYGDAVEYGDSPITAHELASKEAESDAEKRAFRKFGDQFGLILWAKEGERAAIERVARIRADRALGSAGSPERPAAAATTATATAQPSDGGQPSPLPADESPVGEGLHTPASGDGARHSSPAPTGTTFAAPVDTLKPAAQYATGTSEKKTLNLLNTLIVKGRKAGLFTTHDVYSWAREIDPLNVRDDAWYIEADGILHWADLRSEAPVWLCSQLLDRLKLEFPAWFMENAKGRAA